MQERTTHQLIIEIVLRGVATALPRTPPAEIDALAEGLITIVENVVAGLKPQHTINSDSFRSFCIWNAILDEIEKEIPSIEGKIRVFGTVSREQRKAFYATATLDRDREGGITPLGS